MTQLKWVPVGQTVWPSPLRAAWQGHRAAAAAGASERPGRLPASTCHARTCAAAAGWHRHCAQCVCGLTLVMDAHADAAAVCASCMQAAAGRRAHSHSHSACQQKLDEWPGAARPADDLLMSPRPGCMRCVVCTITGRPAAAPNWPANSSYIGQSLAAPFLSERVFGLVLV